MQNVIPSIWFEKDAEAAMNFYADAVWDKLMDGGTPQQCGWIADKFGTIWQITPKEFGAMMSSPDATPAQKQALMRAMLPMVKLDLPQLKAAFESAK